jgi:HD superfamily phosphohydrolase
MPRQFVKWVSDPLYGSIPLTQVEVDVMDTQAFQRLRRVGQLGLVNLVFPSATYTRFMHSLGACHVLGEILDRLESQAESAATEDLDWQAHRLAMLLHDIGHYFMSHATEEAAKSYYADRSTSVAGTEVGVQDLEQNVFLKHESNGKEVLRLDEELAAAIGKHGFQPESIAALFMKEKPTILASLLSSDLDADRIDYLMRSSQATGLPYGFHDRDFILRNLVRCPNQARAEGEPEEFVCIKEKAVRSADHFLLSRMFDYMQVIYQPAVVGFEQMLQVCVKALLQLGKLALDKESMKRHIQERTWHRMDDPWFMELVAREYDNQELRPLERHAMRRLHLRRPAPMIYSYESIAKHPDAARAAHHRSVFSSVVQARPDLAERCIFWSTKFRLMSTPSSSPASLSADKEKLDKVIRVECGERIVPIIEVPQSVASSLGDHVYELARIYYLGDEAHFDESRKSIAEIVSREELPGHIDWNKRYVG